MPTFPYQPSSKLPNAETSIFAVMSKLASEENAINLSQGYPDFPSSPELIALVNKAMQEGYNQYAPMPGIYSLREAIAEKIATLYGMAYDPDSEITVTAGATQAIYTIVSALIEKDDEVIIFAPAYDSYDPTVRLNGGKTVEIELQAPDFGVDWNEVKARISPRTKMIIINSPHNPTGTVLSKEDMLNLEELVKDTGIIILSDEVYEHLIYDNQEHQSIARFPILAQRSFLVASFGKTFHNTGWKMGYCAGPAALMAEFRKVHQFNVFSVNHPVQKALAQYLRNENNYLSLPEFFQAKRDLFLNAIKDSKFKFKPSSGTYFQLLNYSSISVENDFELAQKWTTEKKVASIPVSSFYLDKTDNKVLRFCFAKSDETLLKGAEILNRF
ncbi:methionine aminotransferase [Lutimonas zeaxanthinifaciens]|uniref:methionine aminotransferase n=1 Tax=Lutimonas zeaxanthinifaciens TaxID=3060215 RepID=UPI00265D512F|nr:methionine aminotransferase [Lutimonas sp. YSD2104]WKK65990.1 methionine aminotransferase [Lutimonas sp. YSD2104]